VLTREELVALKPGDEVAWKQGSAWRITTVKTIAATSIVTADHQRWTKKHGKKFACGSDRIWLERVTQEIRDAIEKQALVTRLYRIEWERHTVETLRRVAAIVEGRS
jgi:vacuolar-type H+-ATPase subunit C/Vma6